MDPEDLVNSFDQNKSRVIGKNVESEIANLTHEVDGNGDDVGAAKDEQKSRRVNHQDPLDSSVLEKNTTLERRGDLKIMGSRGVSNGKDGDLKEVLSKRTAQGNACVDVGSNMNQMSGSTYEQAEKQIDLVGERDKMVNLVSGVKEFLQNNVEPEIANPTHEVDDSVEDMMVTIDEPSYRRVDNGNEIDFLILEKSTALEHCGNLNLLGSNGVSSKDGELQKGLTKKTAHGSDCVDRRSNLNQMGGSTNQQVETQKVLDTKRHEIMEMVLSIKEVLQDGEIQSDMVLLELLKLQRMDIDLQILKDTGIGRAVSAFKKHGMKEIRKLVRSLISGWKLKVDEWVAIQNEKLDTEGCVPALNECSSHQKADRDDNNEKFSLPDTKGRAPALNESSFHQKAVTGDGNKKLSFFDREGCPPNEFSSDQMEVTGDKNKKFPFSDTAGCTPALNESSSHPITEGASPLLSPSTELLQMFAGVDHTDFFSILPPHSITGSFPDEDDYPEEKGDPDGEYHKRDGLSERGRRKDLLAKPSNSLDLVEAYNGGDNRCLPNYKHDHQIQSRIDKNELNEEKLGSLSHLQKKLNVDKVEVEVNALSRDGETKRTSRNQRVRSPVRIHNVTKEKPSVREEKRLTEESSGIKHNRTSSTRVGSRAPPTDKNSDKFGQNAESSTSRYQNLVEETRRKLREGYQKAEDAKKRRSTQIVDVSHHWDSKKHKHQKQHHAERR